MQNIFAFRGLSLGEISKVVTLVVAAFALMVAMKSSFRRPLHYGEHMQSILQ